MSIKISLYKSSADGEQLNAEFNLEKRDFDRMAAGESLRKILDPYFRLADDRLREMNLRIMIANRMVKKMPVELQMAFHNIMDVMHGQKPSDQSYTDILKGSIHEVAKELVAQGIDPDLVEKAVRASYGQVAGDGPVSPTPEADKAIQAQVAKIAEEVNEASS